MQFYDDMSGKPLESTLVTEARREEILGANKHGVWEKVSAQKCWDQTHLFPK